MALLTRVAITVHVEKADLLTAWLASNVAHGWEETTLDSGSLICTVHMTHKSAADELTAGARAHFPDARIDVSLIEEADWVEAWKEFFIPVQGGEHFYVLPPWMEEERKNTPLIPIIIEPKTAFGTGHHGTTSLCLDAISSLFSDKKITPNMRFLDLGTGSGILGIGAAKLGLHGEGLDIDQIAVENALENREINGISAEQFVIQRGGIEKAQAPYDLVLANILARPLIEMAELIVPLVKKQGFLVLSGILTTQADDVEVAYLTQGLSKAERYIRGEWASLVFSL